MRHIITLVLILSALITGTTTQATQQTASEDPYTGYAVLYDEQGDLMVAGDVTQWWGDINDEYIVMEIETSNGDTGTWAVRQCDIYG